MPRLKVPAGRTCAGYVAPSGSRPPSPGFGAPSPLAEESLDPESPVFCAAESSPDDPHAAEKIVSEPTRPTSNGAIEKAAKREVMPSRYQSLFAHQCR